MTDDDLERFTRHMGFFGHEPYFVPMEGSEHVVALTRRADETARFFAEVWHSDWSFLEEPPIGTCLYFGIEQARDYLHGLSDRFKALAEDPLQGRVADEFASGLSRYEYQSHVIFFREMEQYTLIVRHTQFRRRVWVARAIRTQDYT